jgi:tRNA A-37 threonylcarbamoyl transferase component Bud32
MDPNNVYIKQNVTPYEYHMHKHVYDLKIVNMPEIISYNKETKVLIMKKINNLNLSDMHGENESDIEEYLFDEVRKIIKTLYDNNIEYPDITGYNFIEHDGKMWIIDFEHSKISSVIKNQFINKFINGLNMWNPEFK